LFKGRLVCIGSAVDFADFVVNVHPLEIKLFNLTIPRNPKDDHEITLTPTIDIAQRISGSV
jgi:hypothetical protein